MPKGLQTQFVHMCDNNNHNFGEIDKKKFEDADRFNSMKKISTENNNKTGKADITHRVYEEVG